jgi:hypothetical protein
MVAHLSSPQLFHTIDSDLPLVNAMTKPERNNQNTCKAVMSGKEIG